MNHHKTLIGTSAIRFLLGLIVLVFSTGCSTSGTPAPAVTLDTQNPYPALVLDNQGSPVNCLAWSPDGELLASGCGGFQSKDYSIRLWMPDGSLVKVLDGQTGQVFDLNWSPDGGSLASASADGSIRLWDAQGNPQKVLESQAGRVLAVAWSPDGQILASGSIVTTTNPTVQLWNSSDQIVKTLSTSFSGGKFYNLAWSPDGKYLLGGATDYKLWRANGEQLFWLQGCAHCTPSWAMAWSPDSQLWALGDESGNVQILTNTGESIAKVVDQSSVNSLAWSPDGQLLAGARTIWSPKGEYLYNLLDQASFVYDVAWSPDGKILASSGSDQMVRLWSPDSKLIASLKGHADNVTVLAWSPDGKILASGSDDGTIRLWMIQQ